MTSIHDPLFYNVTTFMKKNHLTEKQIREFESMDAAQIGSVFFQKGVSTAAHLFFQMIQSYRIAARVANAVWGYHQALEKGDEYNAKEEWKNVERALHDYSPGNFSPYRGDIQFAAEYFEALFNELARYPLERWEEILFVWTKRLHEMLDVKGGPMPKPDVQQVVTGMQRNSQDLFPCIDLEGITHIICSEGQPLLCSVIPPPNARVINAPPNCVDCIRIAGIFRG